MISTFAFAILGILTLAILLALFRFWKGPHVADRIVALDMLSSVGIGIIAVYAIATNQPVFLDVATILALVAFLGTVAFAVYMQRNSDVR